MIFLKEGQAIMHLDAKIPSKGIIETLSDQIAELESLEATGVANSDTCEMLVDLHNLFEKLYAMLLEHARKTLQ
jgi:hypothetical protein